MTATGMNRSAVRANAIADADFSKPMSTLQQKREEARRDYYAAKNELDAHWREINKPGLSALQLLEAMCAESPDRKAANEAATRRLSDTEDRLMSLEDAL